MVESRIDSVQTLLNHTNESNPPSWLADALKNVGIIK